jgi:hypothetical protein
MISVLAITEDGATTEISMIGNEGVAGISALLGVNEAPLPHGSSNFWQGHANKDNCPD